MKIFAQISNETGKIESMGGKEYLDIDIHVKNTVLACFTLRRGELPEEEGEGWVLYDHNDNPLFWIADTGKKQKGGEWCEAHGTERRFCPTDSDEDKYH